MSELSSDLTRFLSTTRGPFHYGINYIASPHTHADQEVRAARLLAARVVTSDLIEKGVAAFSPIVYSRALADCCDTAPVDGWYEFDLNFLALAEGMTILELPAGKPARASFWNWPLPRRGTSRSNCWVGEKSGRSWRRRPSRLWKKAWAAANRLAHWATKDHPPSREGPGRCLDCRAIEEPRREC